MDIGENTLIDKYNSLRNPNKRLWAISPDYTVLLKDDIDEVLELDKKASIIDPQNRNKYVLGTIEHLEKEIEKRLQERHIHKRPRPALWLFSNDMKENIINDSAREGRYRILLKKGSLPLAVVDCKYYHHNIPSSQIKKLIFDAKLSGAKDCYIYTRASVTCWKTKKIYNNGVKLFRIQDYEQPKLIDRTEFSKKYLELIKMFNKPVAL
ncbi:MAG: hypothetical protein ACM3Q2_03135 [Syntrophothermus sp.]